MFLSELFAQISYDNYSQKYEHDPPCPLPSSLKIQRMPVPLHALPCPSARMLLWPVGSLGFHDTQSREEMGLGLGRNFIIGDA